MEKYFNPYAPTNLNGLNDPYPDGYVDFPVMYPQLLTFAADGVYPAQSIPVDTAADFILRGVVVSQNTDFSMRILDASGTYLSNGYILSALLSTSAATPTPIWPEVPFPAGSRLAADFTTTAGGALTIQVVWIGVNRYRL